MAFRLLYGSEHGMAAFRAVEAEFPWLRFFHPNAEAAPWHVQARVTDADGYQRTLNFWPHVQKAQADGEKSVCGQDEMIAMVERVLTEKSPAVIE